MADTTPRLHTAPAENSAVYAPLSWYAMAAFAIAVVFALLLIAFGLSAIVENKPFNESWLLILPVVGGVLAFAGRRHIRNSEGTRQGERYANAAWWICVVGALGYGANLLAIGFTIRSDAARTFGSWTVNLQAANPINPDDPALASAFYPITEAGQRKNFGASDAQKMRAIYGPKFTLFRQTKLLAILARNKGQCEFASEGLQNWEQTPGQIECTLAATLKTPEGDYPLIVPMVAKTVTAGREWQIRIADGYIVEGVAKVPRTPYGWWMEQLSGSAMNAAAEEIKKAAHVPPPAMPEDFYSLLPQDGTGAPHSLDDLKYCWQSASAGRVAMPGAYLSFATERNPFMHIADERIEVRVPVELRPRDAEQNSAARGRLVFQLNDPELLQEIRKARDEWQKGPRTTLPPKEIAERRIPWKLIRLESNLKLEKPPAERGGEGL